MPPMTTLGFPISKRLVSFVAPSTSRRRTANWAAQMRYKGREARRRCGGCLRLSQKFGGPILAPVPDLEFACLKKWLSTGEFVYVSDRLSVRSPGIGNIPQMCERPSPNRSNAA